MFTIVATGWLSPARRSWVCSICALVCCIVSTATIICAQEPAKSAPSPAGLRLSWRELPPLPDTLGLAGPVVGVHDDLLLAGGGANFPAPVWEHEKQWHDRVYALDLQADDANWKTVGRLSEPRAYAACVSTSAGIAMLGGNDAVKTTRECWLIRLDDQGKLVQHRLPDLPEPRAHAQACEIGGFIYVTCGQSDAALASATSAAWRLDLRQWQAQPQKTQWERLPDCPGGARTLAAVTALTDEHGTAMWLVGGRRQQAGSVQFLREVWRFDPSAQQWQQRAPLPVPMAAGSAIAIAPRWIAVVSGDDGQLFSETERLRERHPGFKKQSWIYDAARDQWHSGGATPINQVTTTPVALPGRFILVSGEVRPRVRTNQVWEIVPQSR